MIPTVERRKPLKRTGLKRPTREAVIAWEQKQRTPLRRTRLKQGPGPKAIREKPALDAFRDALRHRSGGDCEAPYSFSTVILGVRRPYILPHSHHPHYGCDPHHMWPEDRDIGLHDPERGLYLCRPVHDWAHDHPELAALAGILRPDRSPRPTL